MEPAEIHNPQIFVATFLYTHLLHMFIFLIAEPIVLLIIFTNFFKIDGA